MTTKYPWPQNPGPKHLDANVQVSSLPIPAGAHWTHSSTVWKDAWQGDGDYPEIVFFTF